MLDDIDLIYSLEVVVMANWVEVIRLRVLLLIVLFPHWLSTCKLEEL